MKRKADSRSIVLIILFSLLFLVLIVRMFQLQIVNGQKYVDDFNLKIKREIVMKGTRGNIYDRNGKLLARNELASSVVFEDKIVYGLDRERQLDLNRKIYKITSMIKENGDSLEDNIKIEIGQDDKYQFTITGFSLDRFKADVYGKASIDEMKKDEKDATAEEIVDYLTDKFCVYSQGDKAYTNEEKVKFGLPDKFGNEELLHILDVRYALSLQAYQKYLAVTVARDVSEETVAAIMENQSELMGVNIEKDSKRVYEGGEACASILGYTGKISSEELKTMKDDGYNISSVVGKAGMEQDLETVLQGADGKKEVFVDNIGRTVQDLGVIEDPHIGKDVYLSIDVDLQNAVYKALERKIADILLQNLINVKYFNKTAMKERDADTKEIRIPIYDVYTALLTNEAIDLTQLQEDDASEVERNVYQSFLIRKENVLKEIQDVLNGTVNYEELSDEMQDYQSFITEKVGILDSSEVDKEAEIYLNWIKGKISLNEYIHGAIKEGWVDVRTLSSEEDYLLQDEVYQLVVSKIAEELQGNTEFDKIIYKYTVLNDEILPEQVCMLLYDQGVLDKQDGDFERWQQGGLSTYKLVVQKISKLEITPAHLALDPCSGSAVITDTKTGQVLACVSYPGYDNNSLANRMDNSYYYKIYNNASLPLYNRATQQLSAPGSTFKPITIIAGLEEGVIDYYKTVECDGVFDKVAPPLKCWNHEGHGAVTSVSSALQHSCNDYLCEVSYRLGMRGSKIFSDEQALEYLQKYAELFDLDKKSGIELAESSPHVTDNLAIPSAIGQGTHNYSTVQLARYVTTLANEGTSFQLSLVKEIDGAESKPEIESKVELSADTWKGVHTGMQWYAQYTNIFDGFPISVAGKSGTAQEMTTRPDHSLFIGYAPADNPEISVSVRIVNGYTSENAVDCARDIFEAYFITE